ncbi:MAG: hypothetical protein RQ735_07200 [Flavobacteriaceae bacterium]|nr:hypothetical protein [Flavobacteriaceae bacterium]
MEQIHFPLTFSFHIGTLHNDFTTTDSHGQTLAYVRQKLLKFVEEVNVYDSKDKRKQIYQLKADRWIDFNAVYSFLDNDGQLLGSLGKKGWNSIWKAHYEIFDSQKKHLFTIREVSPWIKVMDYIFSEIPILGLFSGYFFNPTYSLTDNQGKTIVKLQKQASFWGRKFTASKEIAFGEDHNEKILLGLMMLLILERRRG